MPVSVVIHKWPVVIIHRTRDRRREGTNDLSVASRGVRYHRVADQKRPAPGECSP